MYKTPYNIVLNTLKKIIVSNVKVTIFWHHLHYVVLNGLSIFRVIVLIILNYFNFVVNLTGNKICVFFVKIIFNRMVILQTTKKISVVKKVFIY